MESYTVKQIAEMLNTDPETVRRWIRNKKLKAVQESKKSGNVITKKELDEFLKDNPKYAALLPVSVAAAPVVPALGLVAPAVMSLTLAHLLKLNDKKKTKKEKVNDQISSEELCIIVEEDIKNLKKAIDQHEKVIEEHKAALAEAQKLLKECAEMQKSLKGTKKDKKQL